MAKKKEDNAFFYFGSFCVVIYIFSQIGISLKDIFSAIFSVVLVGLFFYGIYWILFKSVKFKLYQNDKTLAFNIVKEHSKELSVKKSQLLFSSSYGVSDDTKWIKEKNFFIKKVVFPRLKRDVSKQLNKEISDYIEIVATNNTSPNNIGSSDNITPQEYEQLTAAIFQNSGWNAQLTPSGADHGVDVIAEKEGIKVAIQCKLYKNKVGNKAVQEAIAGREFYQTDYAAVVSNAQYTRPAMQLADSANVFLLHHDMIPHFENRIFE